MTGQSNSLLKWLLPLLAAAAGVVFYGIWFYEYITFQVPLRLPGEDGRPVISAEMQLTGEGILETFDGKPSSVQGDWPCFRGAAYDGVSRETTPLLRQIPPAGLKPLWKLELGEGYAAAAIWQGRVYLIDYDMKKQADAVRCVSFDDGRDIWRYSYPVKIKRNHGMSRTIPAVADGVVVVISPKCQVICLDAVSGQKKWAIDLIREYGTKEPLWYAGQCPRIEKGRVIIAAGGKDVLMMAVDCQTGQVVWKTPNPDGWQMSHTSILPMDFAGKRMFVYASDGGIIGVSADDGQVLWKTDQWKLRINVPSPVDIGDGRIFVSAGYNKGSAMIKLEDKNGTIVPNILYTLKPDIFGSDQQTPIYYNGYIYGVRPGEQLVCMDLEGKIRWASGSANKYGLGAYMIADGMLIVLNDDGLLSLIDAVPDGFRLLGQTKVLDGHESWGPPAIVAGRLIVRDLTSMVCLDIAKGN